MDDTGAQRRLYNTSPTLYALSIGFRYQSMLDQIGWLWLFPANPKSSETFMFRMIDNAPGHRGWTTQVPSHSARCLFGSRNTAKCFLLIVGQLWKGIRKLSDWWFGGETQQYCICCFERGSESCPIADSEAKHNKLYLFTVYYRVTGRRPNE